MHAISHLTSAEARRVPWKNGRGVTEELALWPARATFERGDFDWRISRSAVDEAGPFSAFPGFERLLVVTSGAGLLLEHGAAAPSARVRRLESYRFSGDWPTVAALLDGPVADFNVLYRRGSMAAELSVLRPGRGASAAPGAPVVAGSEHTFVHALAGAAVVRVRAEPTVTLAAGESAWVRGALPAGALEIGGSDPETEVLVVRVDGRSGAHVE